MELATPEAGPGQVRVRVKAAGVQPFDCAVRAGWTPPGVTGDLPRVPGNEFAGVIDQVGGAVTGQAAVGGTAGQEAVAGQVGGAVGQEAVAGQVGEAAGQGAVVGASSDAMAGPGGVTIGTEVLGFGRLDAYAEYIVVPADQVVVKPAGMPWEVAGGFSAGAQTAHIALETLGVGKGHTVVIHGAAGAVGTIAVQLAVDRGATVIGTGRPANHEYLRGLGAIPVAYGEGLLERIREAAPDGVDAALDAAGGDALVVSLALVADRGRILTLVEHGKAAELGIRVTPPSRSAARLAELADLHTRGQLRVHVRATYPLERAADAHRDVETGHGRGKVVITMD
ncbi:NADPH:quinone reductase [Actinoplanes regularis]|uniref:NADPH:quinone reductase n=2 Tax=Actinoplanes regularis TaxID=52697 RepID=A0A239D2X1_9ACTN|nr:oxidoreductase [Actinoplanes regularis]SNS26492.1 NADPH:quinone reductase [Actinoplanes regularis]